MKTYQIILEQLGGNKFKVMTGSKNFRYDHNSLVMDLTRNKLGAKWLTITLEADDTYTMLFQKVNRKGIFQLAEIKNVYADMLQDIFTTQTGLYTKL